MSSIVLSGRSPFERAARAVIEAKLSPHTQSAYTADFDAWLQYCYAMRVDPQSGGLEAATAFRNHLMARRAPSSARRTLAALSSIYRTLLRGGAVRANAFHPAVLPWPPVGEVRKTPEVPQHVAESMIEAAWPSERDTALLRLLYDTGLRRASVAGLLRDQLRTSSEGTVFTILTIKGGREVSAGIPTTTVPVLERWLGVAPSSPYVFPGRRGGHIDPSTINKIVHRYAVQAGAPWVSCHCFRAAFVSVGLDIMPAHEVQASVHHVDLTTTQGYDRHVRGLGVAEAVAAKRRSR